MTGELERLCDDPPARRGGRLTTKLCDHSFRATGIATYLKNSGTLKKGLGDGEPRLEAHNAALRQATRCRGSMRSSGS
jgi:hypothetical protein